MRWMLQFVSRQGCWDWDWSTAKSLFALTVDDVSLSVAACAQRHSSQNSIAADSGYGLRICVFVNQSAGCLSRDAIISTACPRHYRFGLSGRHTRQYVDDDVPTSMSSVGLITVFGSRRVHCKHNQSRTKAKTVSRPILGLKYRCLNKAELNVINTTACWMLMSDDTAGLVTSWDNVQYNDVEAKISLNQL